MPKENTKLESVANVLLKAAEKTFESKGTVKFTDKPEIQKKNIIEYDGKMRSAGMDIFNGSTSISTVSFYRSPKDLEDHKACGAIILYIFNEKAEDILKPLGYRGVEVTDLKTVLKCSGELCNDIAGNFKNALSSEGYSDLTLSAPENFHNNVPCGIDFSFDQFDKYELSFFIKKEKVLALEVTMAPPS